MRLIAVIWNVGDKRVDAIVGGKSRGKGGGERKLRGKKIERLMK